MLPEAPFGPNLKFLKPCYTARVVGLKSSAPRQHTKALLRRAPPNPSGEFRIRCERRRLTSFNNGRWSRRSHRSCPGESHGRKTFTWTSWDPSAQLSKEVEEHGHVVGRLLVSVGSRYERGDAVAAE